MRRTAAPYPSVALLIALAPAYANGAAGGAASAEAATAASADAPRVEVQPAATATPATASAPDAGGQTLAPPAPAVAPHAASQDAATAAPATGPAPAGQDGVAAEPARKPDGETPDAAAAAPPAVTAVDLAGLESRLANTDAIGFFAKLELKSQLDDLMTRFERYHAGDADASLDELRQGFNLLLMKILALLQDRDAQLHGDIASARSEIWRAFADPERFAKI